MKFDPNDPRLTAYALGELDETERSELELQLSQSEEGRKAVEEIRRTAELLSRELQKEPLPQLEPEEREAIEAALGADSKTASDKIVPFPRKRFSSAIALSALAASIMALIGLNFIYIEREVPPSEDRLQTGDAIQPLAAPVVSETKTEASQEKMQRLERNEVREHLADHSPDAGKDYLSKATVVSKEQDLNQHPSGAAEPALTPSFPDAQQAPGKMAAVGGLRSKSATPKGESLSFEKKPSMSGYTALSSAPTLRQSAAEAGKERERVDHGMSGRAAGFVEMESAKAAESVGPAIDEEDAMVFRRMVKREGESYERISDNPFLAAESNPLSTFSIDVDTASYANVRRFLTQGSLPPKDAVRIEEMINYFPYAYDGPKGADPFAAHVEISDCPWNREHRLVRIGIKGKEMAAEKRPAANLVFLIDVSGSMQPRNKLPLVQEALRLLVKELSEEDRVAMVVYAGNSGLVLPSTSCRHKQEILDALDRLEAGGSTNGGSGIQLAYRVAVENFIEGGINRVILATDGDFNVGVTDPNELTRLIEKKAKSGVFLSVLGFGMGNVKDSTMEKLADKGNGNYAYIDTLQEARKVLVDQMNGTLVTIAKDVKIQVEFNPAEVNAYRLIGYENRLLAKEDFNDDRKDAGEIGVGHTVTALYEVIPAGEKLNAPGVDPLKYQRPARRTDLNDSGELLTLKLRYKQPDGDKSKFMEIPVKDEGGHWKAASRDFKFAAAVASFGMLLRDSPHQGDATYRKVLEWAEEGMGSDPHGYCAEFIELVNQARTLEREDRSYRSD